MSWHEVGGALGVAGLAPARGSSVAEAARWSATGARAGAAGRGRAGPRGRLPPARGRCRGVARPGRL